MGRASNLAGLEFPRLFRGRVIDRLSEPDENRHVLSSEYCCGLPGRIDSQAMRCDGPLTS